MHIETLNAGYWPVPSPVVHAEAFLTSWKIVELPEGDWHFMGYETTYHEGRVTSKVVEFNPENMTGKTHSGRFYTLQGPPGHDGDAAYVWRQWARHNKVVSYKDISKEVYESHKQGQTKEVFKSQRKRIETQELPRS